MKEILLIPIGDIKEQRNIDRLTGVFHRITNLSLENGSFPKTEKETSVHEAHIEKWQRS